MKKLFTIITIFALAITICSCNKHEQSNNSTKGCNNPNIKIVMLGDSETRRINHYWGADTNWNTLTGIDSIFNFGYDAFNSGSILAEWGSSSPVYQAMDKNPDVIFLMIGINDAHQSMPIASSMYYIRTLIDTIQGRGIDLVMQSVLPTTNYYDTLWGGFPANGILATRAKILTDSIINICLEKDVPFLDVRSGLVTDPIYRSGVTYLLNNKSIDGIHLNYAGYQIWRDHLMGYLINNGYL